MVTISDLARKYAKKYDVTIEYATAVFETTFELIGDYVFKKGEDVSIYGFGSFKHKLMKSKRVRHPGTGLIMMVPERVVVQFHQSEAALRRAKREKLEEEEKNE